MSEVIESLERAQLRAVPAFEPGDRVKVHFQVVEGTRRRTQVFEGVVLKRQGSGARETFTVRKQSFGVGVERTFPVHSPKIERIEVAARGRVRRAKLYYLRDRVGRRARVRERQDVRVGGEAREPAVAAGVPAEEPRDAEGSQLSAEPVVGARGADAEPDADEERAADAGTAADEGTAADGGTALGGEGVEGEQAEESRSEGEGAPDEQAVEPEEAPDEQAEGEAPDQPASA